MVCQLFHDVCVRAFIATLYLKNLDMFPVHAIYKTILLRFRSRCPNFRIMWLAKRYVYKVGAVFHIMSCAKVCFEVVGEILGGDYLKNNPMLKSIILISNPWNGVIE